MIWYVIIAVVSLLVGIALGLFIRFFLLSKKLKNASIRSETILVEAKAEAERNAKAILGEAKQDIIMLKKEADTDIKERRQIILDLENKASQRETNLNNRSINLDKKEEAISLKQSELDKRKNEVEVLKQEIEKIKEGQEAKLHEIAGLTNEQARQKILDDVKDSMDRDIQIFMKNSEEDAKLESEKKARNILAIAIQKYSSDVSSEINISAVTIPNDDIKGKLIGRDGRNIRSFEAVTGTELKIDDTPETVTISGFDPVRREIAVRSLKALIADGRIHPTKIEECVEKNRKEVEALIRQKGEDAVFETNIGRVNPELIKIIGKLHYRTSFGQNNLTHSKEVAYLTGKLAAELGCDETLARRAGLLHDIGKAIDHDVAGSHVDIGVMLATKFKEPVEVIDAIASHHGDVEAKSIIAVLVAAADAISAARPGARSEQLENYLQRIEKLEAIPNAMPGVEKAYAIQAGREVRIIVKPESIDEVQIYQLAKNVKAEIESKLNYPGTIKVTVIRETRATETAK
jgi:ribonuclease Y